MKILFMGTPDFASASLEALYEAGHEICGVFTQPDKPKGRGMKVELSPVKELALAHESRIFQPIRLQTEEALAALHDCAPELIVAVAYGRILPKEFLEYPKFGCINIHGSLLPKYRGSAPIQWSVLNGDAVGGVTAMYMAEGLDCGDIIASRETEIGLYETSGELFERLRHIGAALLCDTIADIEAGRVTRTAQDESLATLAPRLSREDSPIDWTKRDREIVKKVCGLTPWPCATAELGGALLKIYGVRLTETDTPKAPGTVVRADKAGIEVACGEGKTVLITEVQPQGKRRMKAADYLLGHPIRCDA